MSSFQPHTINNHFFELNVGRKYIYSYTNHNNIIIINQDFKAQNNDNTNKIHKKIMFYLVKSLKMCSVVGYENGYWF